MGNNNKNDKQSALPSLVGSCLLRYSLAKNVLCSMCIIPCPFEVQLGLKLVSGEGAPQAVRTKTAAKMMIINGYLRIGLMISFLFIKTNLRPN